MPEPWRTPFASSPEVRVRMSTRARRDTAPEIALRKELFRQGLRYYVHRRPLPELHRTADIVLPRAKLAIFVDGCFWHGCPDHGHRVHKTNAWYWSDKIRRNQERDLDTDRRLRAAGWEPVRVWEHEPVGTATERILHILGRS